MTDQLATKQKFSSDQNGWIEFRDGQKPWAGQQCLIWLAGGRRCMVTYDDENSWLERNPDSDLLGDVDYWFTELDDQNDWWETQYVTHWQPLPGAPV